jgi:hypothetical protein
MSKTASLFSPFSVIFCRFFPALVRGGEEVSADSFIPELTPSKAATVTTAGRGCRTQRSVAGRRLPSDGLYSSQIELLLSTGQRVKRHVRSEDVLVQGQPRPSQPKETERPAYPGYVRVGGSELRDIREFDYCTGRTAS